MIFIFKLRNGESNSSPFILLNSAQGLHQNGRLCQNSLPPPHNTTSNTLRLEFHTDYSTTANGFRLRYHEQSLGCGGRIMLREGDSNEVFISSPNYPRIPPAHTECTWVIMAEPGKRVQIEFVEQFYITPSYR